MMHWLEDEALKYGSIPLCTLEVWEPMSRHSKETRRFGHLVNNDKEYAWHVTEWAWPEREEETK